MRLLVRDQGVAQFHAGADRGIEMEALDVVGHFPDRLVGLAAHLPLRLFASLACGRLVHHQTPHPLQEAV